MEWIQVIDNTCGKDEGHKRTTSLGISENRPHLLAITGGLSHGTDIYFDDINAMRLIEWLQEEIETMTTFHCPHHSIYKASFPKCDNCKELS